MFDVKTNKMETMQFLRLNINDSHNLDMGHVGISDQLREVHKFNVWLRNCKWWRSVFQWGIGVLLANVHVTCKKVLEADAKTPMSHNNFRKEIALSLTNSWEPSIAERRRVRIRHLNPTQTPTTTHNNKRWDAPN